MDKAVNKSSQDQVQAIYLAQANIFAYEARKSAKSWVPLCDSTVPISILYDNTRSIYRIISVDADIKEVVVNTTVIPELEFVKTTQKFGYWKDIASGRVFGIGFASEYEAEAFDECLRKVKQNIGPPPPADNPPNAVNSSSELNSSSSNSANKSDDLNHSSSKTSIHEQGGQGDGPGSLPPIKGSNHNVQLGGIGSASMINNKKMNWDDYEQIAPTVFGFIHQSNQSNQSNNNSWQQSDRPSTYKVELPVIPSPSGNLPPQSNSTTSTALSHAPPPQLPPLPPQTGSYQHQHHPHHHPSSFPPYYLQNNGMGQQQVETMSVDTGHGHGHSHGHLIPLPMQMAQAPPPPHPSYCYQGPPHQRGGLPPTGSARDSKSIQAPSSTCEMVPIRGERNELLDELNRIRGENVKLSQSLIESTCASKKWEVQANSLRDDNILLVKSVADLNTKLESVGKEARELKDKSSRWKEHYEQAVAKAKEKSQQLKEVEDKLKNSLAEKSRMESHLKEVEEELKRQQHLNKEQQQQLMQQQQQQLQNSNSGHHVVAGQFTNKYFKELEEHYRKLLSDSQKRIEEVLRKDADRKNVLRGVDTLFTGAIQGLINIHGQIRQAYEQ